MTHESALTTDEYIIIRATTVVSADALGLIARKNDRLVASARNNRIESNSR